FEEMCSRVPPLSLEIHSFCAVRPATHCAKAFQSGSFLEANCRPPEWKVLPPASGASGCRSSLLLAGSAGTTAAETASKFLRDCSSVQKVAPAGNFSNRKALLLSSWQT